VAPSQYSLLFNGLDKRSFPSSEKTAKRTNHYEAVGRDHCAVKYFYNCIYIQNRIRHLNYSYMLEDKDVNNESFHDFVFLMRRLQLLGFIVDCGAVGGRRSQEKVSFLYLIRNFSSSFVSTGQRHHSLRVQNKIFVFPL
jgi:hypothetical protein